MSNTNIIDFINSRNRLKINNDMYEKYKPEVVSIIKEQSKAASGVLLRDNLFGHDYSAVLKISTSSEYIKSDVKSVVLLTDLNIDENNVTVAELLIVVSPYDIIDNVLNNLDEDLISTYDEDKSFRESKFRLQIQEIATETFKRFIQEQLHH